MGFWQTFYAMLRKAQSADKLMAELRELQTGNAALQLELARMSRLRDFADLERAKLLAQAYLAPPRMGQLRPASDVAQDIPFGLVQYSDRQVKVLSQKEWERFLAWVTPIARARHYEQDVYDCEDYAAVFNGRASEWVGGLACGWLRVAMHMLNWVVTEEGLFYADLTPRDIVQWGGNPPYPEGLFSSLPDGWQVEVASF